MAAVLVRIRSFVALNNHISFLRKSQDFRVTSGNHKSKSFGTKYSTNNQFAVAVYFRGGFNHTPQ